MHALNLLILTLLVVTVFVLIDPTLAYSRVTIVEVHAPYQGKANEGIPVQADIYTGNNRVEYVHDVQATLLLPDSVKLVSGVNPFYIGEMGPGPAHAQVNWTLRFEEAGEFLLTVNASCIDTQTIPQWMNASTTIRVYAPPHVEFEYTPEGRVYANGTITFNATKSFGRGPDCLIATFAWDFGDGTNATTFIPTIQHRFLEIGNYTMSLNVTDDSAFELSSTNTTEISVSLFGDINFDGQVNIVDITIVARAFGSEPGTPEWNPKADLNNDGTVNIIDITLVAREFGKVA